MAVNVGQRNVPDSANNRQLEACIKAMDLAIHTIKICSNKNIFKVEFQNALTDDIIKCAKDIYMLTWDANNTYVRIGDKLAWRNREIRQLGAITKCNELIALINIARRLFHLKGNKVKYWSQLTLDTRGLIRRWHEANAKQFGM